MWCLRKERFIRIKQSANKCTSSFETFILFVVTNTNLCFSYVQFPSSCFVTALIQLIHRKRQLRPKTSLTFKWMDLRLRLIALLLVKHKNWAERQSGTVYHCFCPCILRAMTMFMLHEMQHTQTWGQPIITFHRKIHIIIHESILTSSS